MSLNFNNSEFFEELKSTFFFSLTAETKRKEQVMLNLYNEELHSLYQILLG
jgi:hypothetical protein